jgi:septum formation protein
MPKNVLPAFVLASQSTRRRQLAIQAGWNCRFLSPPDSAEDACQPRGPAEPVVDYVIRLARAKAAAIAANGLEPIILACDKVSEINGAILGKPRDRHHAEQMLRQISGQAHRVFTGISLWRRVDTHNYRRQETALESTVFMDALTEPLLATYLESSAWVGKAGACGLQDGYLPLRLLTGSPDTVEGLPVARVEQLLREATPDEHPRDPLIHPFVAPPAMDVP